MTARLAALAAVLPGSVVRRQLAAADRRRLNALEPDSPEWATRQLDALARVWTDAIADVPHYARLAAEGRAPRAIRSWDEFRAVPILTRQAIQDRPQDFVRRSGPPASVVSTAGSTGTPLRMGVGAAERALMRVVKLAEWRRFGYSPGSRLFLLWGHSHLLGTSWRGQAAHTRRRLADWYLGYRRVDAYRLTSERCRSYAERLVRFRPLGVIGYAAALDLFARATIDLRPRYRALGVRFVLATAEAPPRPDTVPLLEDLFGCPVVQEYGGAEFGQVAFRVGTEPFHVYADLNHVECEASAPHPDEGRPALVTSLYPRYVPLIRYRVGDCLAEPLVQAHGHVAAFRAVGGRINDVIHLGEGDAIHSVAVFHCIHQEAGVHTIQMVLHDDGVEVRLVTAPGVDRPSMEARIRARLSQVHPSLARVRFAYVDDIETTRAGKRRWYVDERTAPPCAASPAS